ncbi:hypothetical protein AB4865_06250 [Capnocytophaga sp. ARDL2]|uniref:hypothetical protein n=1 Tax=Capnocytophaga sp. ARDL2 TaxID=3238809 RepID=UPI0035585663
MTHYLKFTIISSFIFLFLACSVNRKIQKNEKKTFFLSEKIYKKNKNIIVVSYEIANYSFILSYNEGKYDIYKLINGKIVSEINLPSKVNFFESIKKSTCFTDNLECEEWHSYYIFVKYYSDNLEKNEYYSIDMKCFVESVSSSELEIELKDILKELKKRDSSLYID